MSFDSLLPLEYFFSPVVRTKQTFRSGFPIWNIPIWSKGYTRTRDPWYERNLYTDLDRSWDEAQIYGEGVSPSEAGSLLWQGGKATIKKGAWRAFIGQQALLAGMYYSMRYLEGTDIVRESDPYSQPQ